MKKLLLLLLPILALCLPQKASAENTIMWTTDKNYLFTTDHANDLKYTTSTKKPEPADPVNNINSSYMKGSTKFTAFLRYAKDTGNNPEDYVKMFAVYKDVNTSFVATITNDVCNLRKSSDSAPVTLTFKTRYGKINSIRIHIDTNEGATTLAPVHGLNDVFTKRLSKFY